MPGINWGDDGSKPFAVDSSEVDGSQLAVRNPKPDVSQIMLGGASIGCLFKEVKPDQAKECVDRAVEAGIRYVDTAPWYGAGLSESRLGEYLEGKPEVLISTKCGRIVVPKEELTKTVGHLQYECSNSEKDYEGHFFTDNYHMNRVCWTYTGDGIRESVRQSCERLRRDTIHCLRLHDAENTERFAAATAPGGAVDAMIKLKAEGTVKELSLGMNNAEYILALLRKCPRHRLPPFSSRAQNLLTFLLGARPGDV